MSQHRERLHGGTETPGSPAFADDPGFERAANRVPLLLWASGADRRHTWCNDQWTAFTGRSLVQELGHGWTEVVHPDDIARVLEASSEAFGRQEKFSVEYRLRRADGEYRWILDQGVPWRASDGTFVGFAGLCVDVHETRTALEEFRLRERQQAIVADLGKFAIQVDDEQELLDFAVKVLADGLGVPLTAAMALVDDGSRLEIKAGTGWDAVLLGTTLVSADSSTMAGYTLQTDGWAVTEDLAFETRFAGGPGLQAHHVVSAMSTLIRLPGRSFGVLGAYATEWRRFDEDDISFARSVANLLGASFARREVEEELRGRELEARLAFAAGRMGSWRWDIRTGEVSWSKEMEAAYGLEPGTFGGTLAAFVERIHPDDRERIAAELELATAAGADFSMEHRVLMDDGRVRWFEGRGAPERSPDGEVTSWIGVGIDITESKEIEQELRENELEAGLAFSAGHMGSWRWNPRTNQGSWSSELEDLVGIERGSYDGTWDAFVGPILIEDGPHLRDVITAAARAGDEFTVGYRIRRPDGVIRWIETRGRELEKDGDWIGVSIDVTEQHRAEAALRESNERLGETVGRLDTLLANAPLGFAFYDRDLRYVRLNQPLADNNGIPIEDHLGRRVSEVLPDIGVRVEKMLRAVLESGVPISDVEVTGQTPAQPGVERHWLASFYPVRGNDDVPVEVGSIVVEITERKREERAALLRGALSELLAAGSDLGELLERAAEVMVPALADSCSIYLLPRTDVARRFAVAHADDAMARELADADRRWPLDLSRMLAETPALSEGRAVVAKHVTDGMRRAFAQSEEHLDLMTRMAVRSSIIAPLHVGEDVVGLLCLDDTVVSGRVFRPEDLALVEDLADRIVVVLERAYLSDQAAHARARLDLLAQVSELLTVGLDTRARLEAVVDVVLPTFGDACVAYLLGDAGLHPAVCRVVDAPDDPCRRVTGVPSSELGGDGAVATAFRTREPVLVGEVQPGTEDPAGALGLHSMLVVPLLSADEPFGVLGFGYAQSGRRYGSDDLGLAREIAGRVAPTVDDAMRFERELATAEALQRSLLPDQLPELQDADLATRYVPGGVGLKVGGDWYDAVQLRNGRVMLVIGDVVGHGVRAAASMGKLRNVLQYSALDGLAPAEVLQRLNAYFFALADADMATLLVAEYDPAGQRIRYSNAGHPPAMLRMPDGSVEVLDDGRSMPLCATDQARYREAEHDLPPGSILVLYTDGLIERRGESLDAGLARLRSSLGTAPAAVEDVADTLLADFLAEDLPADDVALLCFGVRGPDEALRLRIPATARQLSGMRRAVQEWLTRAGASSAESHEIALAVNEAAANAIEHTYGLSDEEFVLEADQRGDAVELVVRDSGRWRTRRSPGDRGRGLALARALMDSVDVEPGTEGTVVRLRRRLGGTAGDR